MLQRMLWIVVVLSFVSAGYGVDTIGKWERYVVAIPNSSYSGNPFELEVDGIFTHTATGTVIQLPGYYAGNDVWKIGFMPTLTGEWTYTTTSSDPELNGVQGAVNCVESGLPGMLKADDLSGKKWRFSDSGQYVIPMAFRMDFFYEPATTSQFEQAADFLKNQVKGQLLETRLMDEYGDYNGRTDYIFQGNWQDHQFDLTYWDQMEQRMTILTERGLGAHVMFYADDAGRPRWSGQSPTEALVIRYAVARLAGFPVVWFNTGIDISEYRSKADVDWFGAELRGLDPYDHPISSRYGGGSGNFVMSGQTFDSRGDRTAIINDMIGYFNSANVPVSMDDAWGENRPSRPNKNFRPEDIRRAFWKCVLAGGLGALVRGGAGDSRDGFFSPIYFEDELESEQWLQFVNPFVQEKLGETFGEMVPSPSLVSNGYCLSDPARTKLLYFYLGVNDKWDSGSSSPLTLRISALSQSYDATWLDPRTGDEIPAGAFSGGADMDVTPPSTDDWVLLLTIGTPDSTPPSVPGDVTANPVSEFEITLNWSPSQDPESGIQKYRVYRDGSMVAQPASTTFSDTGLQEATAYTYEISAVNGAGLESGKSTPLAAQTLADTTPPTILSVSMGGDPTRVNVVFSEPVDMASATTSSNYSIDNGISVFSADLDVAAETVTLSTSAHTPGIQYTLTVNNVKDRASTPNAILPNSRYSYTYNETIAVTNLQVQSGENYAVQENLAVGAMAYVDRNYTYEALPASLVGKPVYIQTANDDKLSEGDQFLSFEVDQNVVVYVLHDDRYQLKPQWLGAFTDTGEKVTIQGKTHSVFRKSFLAGLVELGGNVNPAEKEDNSMYTVVLGPDSEPPPPAKPSPPRKLSIGK